MYQIAGLNDLTTQIGDERMAKKEIYNDNGTMFSSNSRSKKSVSNIATHGIAELFRQLKRTLLICAVTLILAVCIYLWGVSIEANDTSTEFLHPGGFFHILLGLILGIGSITAGFVSTLSYIITLKVKINEKTIERIVLMIAIFMLIVIVYFLTIYKIIEF